MLDSIKKLHIFDIFLIVTLVAEITRKFIFGTEYTLLVIDLVLIWCGLNALKNWLPSKLTILIFLSLGLHGLMNAILYGLNPSFVFSGFRELAYIFIGYRLGSSTDFDVKNLKIPIFAIVLVSLIATIQIIDPTTFLNNMHPDIPLGTSLGRGSYDPRVEEALGVSLYRPTSIFPTTGKYGAFVAALSIFLLAALTVGWRHYNRPQVTLIILIVLISNQIALQRAFYYYAILIALFHYIVFYLSREGRYLLAGLTLSGTASIVLLEIQPFAAIINRLAIFPVEIYTRMSDLGLMAGLFADKAALLGYGFGYFSTGATLMGGSAYHFHFGGEGGWHVAIASIGLISIIFFLIVVITNFISKVKKNRTAYSRGSLNLYLGPYVFGLLFFWGLTHNIYGWTNFLFIVMFSVGVLEKNNNTTSN